jgi:hypothetical protein
MMHDALIKEEKKKEPYEGKRGRGRRRRRRRGRRRK